MGSDLNEVGGVSRVVDNKPDNGHYPGQPILPPHYNRQTRDEAELAAQHRSYQAPRKSTPVEVTKPSHYNRGGIECIDAIKAMLTDETDPHRAYVRASMLKYVWRLGHKGKPLTDAQKAKQYAEWLVEHEQAKDAEKGA